MLVDQVVSLKSMGQWCFIISNHIKITEIGMIIMKHFHREVNGSICTNVHKHE